MTQADSVHSTPRETASSPKAPTPSERELDIGRSVEAYYLRKCAQWHVYRARQQLHWASLNLAEETGEAKDELDTTALCNMKQIEDDLQQWVPRTTLGAERLLEIVIAIETHAQNDREEHFGQGPTLEYLRNLRRSLGSYSFPDATTEDDAPSARKEPNDD